MNWLIPSFYEYLLLFWTITFYFAMKTAYVNVGNQQGFNFSYAFQICSHQFQSSSIFTLVQKKITPIYIKYRTMFHWLINCTDSCFTLVIFCVPVETNKWTSSRKWQWLSCCADFFVTYPISNVLVPNIYTCCFQKKKTLADKNQSHVSISGQKNLSCLFLWHSICVSIYLIYVRNIYRLYLDTTLDGILMVRLRTVQQWTIQQASILWLID
jgi:hypothetical protein